MTGAQREAFWAVYSDAEIRDTYDALAAVLHWRIAVYCLLRSEQGASDYAQASAKEFELVRQLTNGKERPAN
jgi:hypothetical protein